jgi:hypothetical protein
VEQISIVYEFKTNFSKLYPVFKKNQKYTWLSYRMAASPLIPLQIMGKDFFKKNNTLATHHHGFFLKIKTACRQPGWRPATSPATSAIKFFIFTNYNFSYFFKN